MNASAAPAADAATAALSPSLAALTGRPAATPLTRVSLAFLEHRFKLYLRFGEPARTLRYDRWRSCAASKGVQACITMSCQRIVP